MVHHRVERVVESRVLIQKEDRLNGAIPRIVVEVLELHEANVGEVTHVDLLLRVVLTARVSATDRLVIRHDNEIGSCVRWSVSASEGCAAEGEDEVVGSCAWEVSAVLDIGPMIVRLFKIGPACVINVFEHCVIKEVRRDLVRILEIAFKNHRSGTAFRFTNEVLKVASVDGYFTTPVAFALRHVDR